MMNSYRPLALAATFAAVALFAAGCTSTATPSDGSTADTGIPSSVHEVVVDGLMPYSSLAGAGASDGYVPDVTAAIFKELGITKGAVSAAPFSGLLPGLEANRWDIISTGLNITEARCEAIIYSRPILYTPETFLVEVGNPKGISSYEDFLDDSSLIMGQTAGGPNEAHARSIGVADSQIITSDTAANLLSLLASGRVDAIGNTEVTNLRHLRQNPGQYEIVELAGLHPTIVGLGFRKSDVKFRDAVNEVLDDMIASGELEEISNKWELLHFDMATDEEFTDLTHISPNCE